MPWDSAATTITPISPSASVTDNPPDAYPDASQALRPSPRSTLRPRPAISSMDTIERPAERFAAPAIALTINTPYGPAHGVWRPSSQRHAAALLLAGADNDAGGPAGLYNALAPRLQRVAAVAQLSYPASANCPTTNRDVVLSVLESYKGRGIERVVLIGWGMGGAVAAAVGARCPLVTGVACLAPDPEASDTLAGDIAAISPRRLLIAHGSDDTRIPPSASIVLASHAGSPTELALYPNETHDFIHARAAILDRLTRWASTVLRSPFRPTVRV